MEINITRTLQISSYYQTYQYSQVHNEQGGQNKRGGFKDFEKLIDGGVKISGGWVETKYKRKEMKIGLSLLTLLTSLNIGISSILWSRLH